MDTCKLFLRKLSSIDSGFSAPQHQIWSLQNVLKNCYKIYCSERVKIQKRKSSYKKKYIINKTNEHGVIIYKKYIDNTHPRSSVLDLFCNLEKFRFASFVLTMTTKLLCINVI